MQCYFFSLCTYKLEKKIVNFVEFVSLFYLFICAFSHRDHWPGHKDRWKVCTYVQYQSDISLMKIQKVWSSNNTNKTLLQQTATASGLHMNVDASAFLAARLPGLMQRYGMPSNHMDSFIFKTWNFQLVKNSFYVLLSLETVFGLQRAPRLCTHLCGVHLHTEPD
jgi:hypothetical protein